MAAWKVALRLSRRLRMVPALSSAEGRDRHAAEGGSLAQKRGLDSPERGRPLWGLPDCENAPAILWTALGTHLAAKARRSLRRSSTMATST